MYIRWSSAIRAKGPDKNVQIKNVQIENVQIRNIQMRDKLPRAAMKTGVLLP